MTYLKHFHEKPRWLDSRVYSPEAHGTSRFAVIVLYSGVVMDGMATWMPNCNYKDGYWVNVTSYTGNPWESAQVLYWHQHLGKPMPSVNQIE